jgi:hypothetical protein
MESPSESARGRFRVWVSPSSLRLAGAICFLPWLSLLAGSSLADVVEVDPFEFSTATVEIIWLDGTAEWVELRGSSEMHVSFEGTSEGDAFDDDGDGLDEVDAKLAELQLSGASPFFGAVALGLDPASPSLGVMKEKLNATPGLLDVPPFAATGQLDSFFDVFFAMDLGGLQLHNVDPMRLSSVISTKPPAATDTYESIQDIPLYDPDGNLTGIYVGATNVRFLPEPQSGLLIAIAALSILNRVRPLRRRPCRAD